MDRRKFIKGFGAAACAVVLSSSLALFGCSSNAADEEAPAEDAPAAEYGDFTGIELSVYAANSLQKALPEVQELFTAATGATFADTQFEASGTLVSKLQEAPESADVLITASKKTMDNASTNGSIDDATRVDMFVNDLVIVAASDSGIQIASMDDLATDAVTSIAIGDPNVVPAGKYALQCLESAGYVTYEEADDGTIENIVWDPAIADKINAGADKVGTVASYVAEGICDVGFVYTSDIFRYDGITSVFVTPADSHKNILYPGAVTAASANADAAAAFIQFCMTDPDAIAVFQEYGFELAA